MVLDDRIDLRDVQLRSVAMNAWHIFVDLDDKPLGRARDLGRIVVAGTESEIAVPIHRRDGADEGLDPDLADQQPRRLMRVVGYIVDDLAPAIGLSTLDQRPLGRSDEHTVRANAADQLVAKDSVSGDSGGLEIIELENLDSAGFGPIRQRNRGSQALLFRV